jgi:glycosyltransferase involved in cell wall biosynthesis
LHVLHVVGSSDLGIEENHVFQLATALASRGVRVDVACPQAGPFSDRLRGAEIEPIVLPFLAPRPDQEFDLSWPAVRSLAEVCRSLRPDLVHTHLHPAAFHGLLAAHEAGVRAVIHTAHTFKARSAEMLLTRLGGCHLIALTRTCAAQFERAGVPRQQLTVVHNGIPPLGPNAAGGRPLPPMSGIVVGSLAPDPAWGPNLLLRAAAAWRPRLPAFTLLVAGEEPAVASLRQLAAELGLRARIAFAETSTHRGGLLSAMDIVCVFPSPDDACPAAVLEAMLAGKAVIAPDLAGIDELLEPGQEGLLVRPEDPAALTEAVLALAQDRALRTRLGASARQRVASDFTLERMVDRTLEVYRRVVGAGKVALRHEQPLRAVPNEILDPAAAP